MDTKRCPQCQTVKPVSDFYRNPARKADGLSPYCVECSHVAQRASRIKIRTELLTVLGSVCGHCGFSDSRALEVDHVSGGGREHRQTIPAHSRRFVVEVAAHPDDYQLLCGNCHRIKMHEEKEWTGNGVKRVPPLTKEVGVGRGNAPQQKAALNLARTPDAQRSRALQRWATETRRVYEPDGRWHHSNPGDIDYPV